MKFMFFSLLNLSDLSELVVDEFQLFDDDNI